MNKLRIACSVVIILAMAVLCQQVIVNSRYNQLNKLESSELNHIKYGLFSIDTWKGQISEIIATEIDRLYLTRDNEKELKGHVEKQLHTFIDKVYEKIEATNKGSTGGWIKQRFVNNFMDKKTVKEGVPAYADAIIAEMTKNRTEIKFKAVIKQKVDEYFEKTFDKQDKSQLEAIILSTGSRDLEDARLRVAANSVRLEHLINQQAIALITLAIILFLITYTTSGGLLSWQYILVVMSLICLLISGVTMPMIDMEAKITNMSFQLMGHDMAFKNQVLYFQSKSIIDVFWVMIQHPEFQMKAVGLLMIGFSIIFPLIKLICSLIYFYDVKGARKSKIIDFFVLKSGKWSMADVMVVAIFMAYIGFNGIINSQFSKFSSKDSEIMIIATNGTSLQAGYYLFLTYTILALFLPGLLMRPRRVALPEVAIQKKNASVLKSVQA